ncbi:hypothetical protein Tco_0410980 [Tanacetum coccineum]
MAVLESCPKHNMVAYLEKTEGNAEFHEDGVLLQRPLKPQLHISSQPSEANVEPQSNQSPRPSPTPHIPDSIPEVSGGNHGGQSSSDKSFSGNEGDMTTPMLFDLCYLFVLHECIIEAKIGRKEVLKETMDAKGVCIQKGVKSGQS